MSGPVAVVLPGRAYPVTLPAIASVADVVRERHEVRSVSWSVDGMPTDPTAFVVDRAQAAAGGEPPALVVGKSLSTLASRWAAEQGCPAIWVTPLLEERAVVEGIRANPARQLLVCGLVDPAHDRGVAASLVAEAASVELLELPLLDHALSASGDGTMGRADIERVAAATRAFLDGGLA